MKTSLNDLQKSITEIKNYKIVFENEYRKRFLTLDTEFKNGMSILDKKLNDLEILFKRRLVKELQYIECIKSENYV